MRRQPLETKESSETLETRNVWPLNLIPRMTSLKTKKLLKKVNNDFPNKIGLIIR